MYLQDSNIIAYIRERDGVDVERLINWLNIPVSMRKDVVSDCSNSYGVQTRVRSR